MFCLGQNCLFVESGCEIQSRSKATWTHLCFGSVLLQECLSPSLLLYCWLSLQFFPQEMWCCFHVHTVFGCESGFTPLLLPFNHCQCCGLLSVAAASLRRAFGGRGRCGSRNLISCSVSLDLCAHFSSRSEKRQLRNTHPRAYDRRTDLSVTVRTVCLKQTLPWSDSGIHSFCFHRLSHAESEYWDVFLLDNSNQINSSELELGWIIK